jgi:hypothetical protein
VAGKSAQVCDRTGESPARVRHRISPRHRHAQARPCDTDHRSSRARSRSRPVPPVDTRLPLRYPPAANTARLVATAVHARHALLSVDRPFGVASSMPVGRIMGRIRRRPPVFNGVWNGARSIYYQRLWTSADIGLAPLTAATRVRIPQGTPVTPGVDKPLKIIGLI